MTYPSVVTTNAVSGVRGANILNGVPVEVGETLVLIITAATGTIHGTSSSGWTSLGSVAAGSVNSCAVFTRKASSTTEAFVLSGGSLSSTISNGQLLRIVGGDVVSCSLYASTTTSSTFLNPPAHTSSSTIGEYLWLAVRNANDAGSVTPPSGYSDLTVARANTSNPSVAVARKVSTSRTEDPGAFTGTATRSTLGTVAISAASVGSGEQPTEPTPTPNPSRKPIRYSFSF